MEEDTAAPSAQSAVRNRRKRFKLTLQLIYFFRYTQRCTDTTIHAQEHFTQNQLSLLRRQIQHLKLINIRLKTAALQVLSPPSVAYNARGPRSTGTGTRTGKASARKKRKAPDEDEDDHVDHEDDSIINDDKEETPPPTSASEEELNSSIDEEITSESELSESSLDSATMLNGNRGVDGDDGPASPPLPRRTTPRASRNRRTVAILDIPSGDDNEDFDIIIDDDDNQTKNAANAATATTTTGKKKSQSLTQDKKLYKTTEAGAPTTDEIKLQALTPITVTWCPDSDADLVCSVCAEGESTDDVPILLCDGPGCDVAVHTACYGVGTVPKGEWLCDVCLDRNRNRNKGSVGATVGRGTKGRGDSSTAKAHKGKKTTMHDDEYPYRCILCPVLGGAMKQVTTFGPVVPPPTPSDSASSAWVHLCCALWSTEVIIRDAVKMKDVDVSGLAKERLALLCGCCRQRGSAPVYVFLFFIYKLID